MESTLENTDNEFEYLSTGDFSAEGYKVEIKNLPKHYGVRELRNYIQKDLALPLTKLKIPTANSRYAFVCFKDEEQRDNALSVLNCATFKKHKLNACFAKACADPLIKKRKVDDIGENKSAKIQKTISAEESVRDVTSPLWNMPYSEQLQLKQSKIRQLLCNLHNAITEKLNPVILQKEWAKKRISEYDGLICALNSIEPSPHIRGYRNKCEFTIGIDSSNGERTVGFRLGKYADGLINVGPVGGLEHIPDNMKAVVQAFEVFVRKCTLEVFSPYLNKGHLKQLTVRCGSGGIMVIMQIHPQQLTTDQIKDFQDQLVEFFFYSDTGSGLGVVSLYYEASKRKSEGDVDSSNLQLLHGAAYITESLHGLQFRISPQSFFQVNSAAAATLYDVVLRLAGLKEEGAGSQQSKPTLIDVCCGTGTIGLTASQYCEVVYGLEYCESAVRDAEENATVNKISNCTFIQGKAEDTLPPLLLRIPASQSDIIAIVDPPRSGLAKSIITTLRTQKRIKRLVYVSCNAKQAMHNFEALSKRPSKQIGGTPFLPKLAVAVDMFPHTDHCELVLLFERFDVHLS